MSNPEFKIIYGIPVNIDREKVMTGQVLFQSSIPSTPTNDDTDRELMVIVGVVAVPKNSPIVEHLQYPVLGEFDQNMFQDMTIHLDINESSNPGNLKGLGISGIIKSPIWRV